MSEKRLDKFRVFAYAVLLVVGVTAIARANDAPKPVGTGASTVEVTLKEFSISPGTITVAEGGSLHIVNAGSIPHNFSIQDSGVNTADIDSGQSADLDLASLKPGTYEVVCTIAGHADGGMKAKLTISSGGAAPAVVAGGTDTATRDMAAMEEEMLASMAAFPAKTTGVGNQPLAPTSTEADGTKVFDLTSAVTKWEVSPGKVVDAWTYNGMVPAPLIKLNVGDKVKINLHNKLPLGTDLHLHGINLENEFDGVSPLTQKLIKTADSFTYRFTADEAAVAMYHSHFMSQIGVPNGLFGAIYVGEMPLPEGRSISRRQMPANISVTQRFPMVLNDSGVIGYSLNGKSFPATAPIAGSVGDWIEFDYFNEGTQIHPMHLHQFDQVVIAKDGFPLDSPYIVDTLNVAPGERYTVLTQLDKPGAWVWHCHILPHVEKDTGMFGMVTAITVK